MSVLVQRSVLGQSGYPLDQIHIRGIAARGFHGVLQSEREAGQDFSADVTLYLDTRAAARGDDLTETVNYALVAEDVHAILSGEPVNLVETVAERIADAVLTRAQVISVDVTVHKPQAPIPLPFDDVVVTIHRDRVNVPVTSVPLDAPAAADLEADADDGTDPLGTTDVPFLPERDDETVQAPAQPPAFAPAPAPQEQSHPRVVSRTASGQVPMARPADAGEPIGHPGDGASTEPVRSDPPAFVPTFAFSPPPPSPDPAPAPTSAPTRIPAPVPAPAPMRVPAPDATAFIPRQTVPLAGDTVRRPTSQEIAVLEEQARVSAERRRPEVFGVTRITAGDRPDFVLDQTTVFSAVTADEPRQVAPVRTAASEERSAEPAASETTALLDPVAMLDRMDTRPSEPVDVVVALGGNLGEPQETLRQAVADLGAVAGTRIVAVGPLARSAAVGGPEQPDYLNTVVLLQTTSSARELLHGCQRIEQAHGRERIERWGPRTLDIDIILYDSLIDSADDLELPHPRAHERSFVLAPWAHVDPDAVLPGLGGGPVAALAATAPDRDGIRWLALDWLQEAEEATEDRRASPPSIAPQQSNPTPPRGEDTGRPGSVETLMPRE